jgi:hypothetical protein
LVLVSLLLLPSRWRLQLVSLSQRRLLLQSPQASAWAIRRSQPQKYQPGPSHIRCLAAPPCRTEWMK